MSLKHPVIDSFPFAISGLKIAFKNEPNLKVHLSFGLVAVILALKLGFNTLEMAVLILTVAIVILLELINTVLEAVVNLVSPEIKQQAKIAKDVSAAAVLVSAFFSLLIGACLFLPKIVQL